MLGEKAIDQAAEQEVEVLSPRARGHWSHHGPDVAAVSLEDTGQPMESSCAGLGLWQRIKPQSCWQLIGTASCRHQARHTADETSLKMWPVL